MEISLHLSGPPQGCPVGWRTTVFLISDWNFPTETVSLLLTLSLGIPSNPLFEQLGTVTTTPSGLLFPNQTMQLLRIPWWSRALVVSALDTVSKQGLIRAL